MAPSTNCRINSAPHGSMKECPPPPLPMLMMRQHSGVLAVTQRREIRVDFDLRIIAGGIEIEFRLPLGKDQIVLAQPGIVAGRMRYSLLSHYILDRDARQKAYAGEKAMIPRFRRTALLNQHQSPRPALALRPAIAEPKLMAPLKRTA